MQDLGEYQRQISPVRVTMAALSIPIQVIMFSSITPERDVSATYGKQFWKSYNIASISV